MQIGKKLESAINRQIGEEIGSSYIYLSMAAYFEGEGLKGFAKWMRKQVAEETSHAMKFFDFVLDRSGKVELPPIEAPKSSWKSPAEAFEDAYKHEQKITGLIHQLVALSQKEGDKTAEVFLNWFVTEQIEEEAQVVEILQRLQIGGTGAGLLMIDEEVGKRE